MNLRIFFPFLPYEYLWRDLGDSGSQGERVPIHQTTPFYLKHKSVVVHIHTQSFLLPFQVNFFHFFLMNTCGVSLVIQVHEVRECLYIKLHPSI